MIILFKRNIFLLILLISCLDLHANKRSYGNIFVSDIVSVYDGDTFRANIYTYPKIIGENIPIRINGVDCHEIRSNDINKKIAAYEARDFTRNELLKATIIELRNIRRGKYFRIIADVYVDDLNLSDLLIENGLGRPYKGGKRQHVQKH